MHREVVGWNLRVLIYSAIFKIKNYMHFTDFRTCTVLKLQSLVNVNSINLLSTSSECAANTKSDCYFGTSKWPLKMSNELVKVKKYISLT